MVESIVAIFVLAIFSTGACKLLLSHRAIADVTREHYTAVNIAKNRIELARTFSFNSLSGFQETRVPVDAFGDPTTASLATYLRNTDINMITNNLIELTVKVDVRDHKTWKFAGASQEVKSFISFHP